ncbi:MAG: pilus assembly protein PilP [Bdellovibrio sp.]|nr:pilus assembly protein PilP [Bdellovibrio sp.]
MKSVRWMLSYIIVASLGLWLAFAVSVKLMTPAHSQEAPASGDLPAEFLQEVESTQIPPDGTVPPPPSDIPPPPAADTMPIGDGATVAAPPDQGQELFPTDGYVYDPTGKRDPFKPFKVMHSGNTNKGGSSIVSGTDATGQSTLEPLQRWEIERLKVVGILWDVRTPRAMVRDPDGAVFTVVKNSKLGRNEGFVVAIREGEVVVMETRYDEGRPVKEPRVMELKK